MEEKDIQQIMQENDGQELLRMACDVRSALASQQNQPDVDAEWKRFSQTHSRVSPLFIWRKYVAVAACIILVCGIGIAAVLPSLRQQKAESENPVLPSTEENTVGIEHQQTAQNAFTFQNATLEEVMQQLSVYYQAEVKYANPEKRSIRLHIQLDKSLSLAEAVQFLNHFEKVKLRLTDSRTVIVE